MLELSHLCVPSRFLSFVTKHKLSLLGLSSGCPLLDFSFAIVEVFSFFIQLGLEV